MKRSFFGYLVIFFIISAVALTAACSPRKVSPPTPPPRIEEPEREPVRPEPPEEKLDRARKYTVLGQTYIPLSSSEGFEEEGIASWYGPKFHGKKTASGEVYNMYEISAAHRILPMHTKVEVTNLENDKSIRLRINDRGPFVDDRIIDLSMAAAKELDMIGPGTAPVRVKAVGSAPRDELPGTFYVQVGSFTTRENAENKKGRVQEKGYSETRLQKNDSGGQTVWRVQAGRFENVGQAEKARDSLRESYPEAFIIAD
ncbi:septal ring lytic transglycosylase RlpA family protein [Desulfonatronospira sp. MSAO_Bac3]|uniref:septal ring lytic transglycosylase RlpA family protein n=1 Tax=Desulfonatronospira sp. MSAO_Bac3 TaxID=2293857 RepID=UPI000FF1A98E|nr:septal ring lytic transglycosylase RlpA family protein [Desulfonatronospira sp. MSAO_Bac3]RQD75197.1 MAG: septal ring lytic transglycosylase RlpA family protein [Desulfonatronospira sp. MSAO_Bac3]